MVRRERRREVDRLAVPLHLRGADRVGGGPGNHLLDEPHHVGVVGEGLVELQHRELGIVPGRHAFVAEDPGDLEHPVEAAHDQSLEVQLRGNAQVEVGVERVVVRHERAGGRAAQDRVQHRRLDLDVAALGEVAIASTATAPKRTANTRRASSLAMRST